LRYRLHPRYDPPEQMNNIEIIIGLLLLFMAVPDVCRRLGRPALVFPAFVVFGLALGPVANAGVTTMLHEAGVVGLLMTVLAVVFLPATRAAGNESGPTVAPPPPKTLADSSCASQPLESVILNPRPPC